MHSHCIVTSLLQQVRELDREVLIDLELHSLGHYDNTLARQVGGIRDRGLYRFLRQSGVALQDLSNQ
jgi:hypothetical protein